MQKKIFKDDFSIELEIVHKDKIIKNRKVKVWTSQEDNLLLKLYQKYPKQWTQIASNIPNRNQNQCLHRYRRLSQNGLIIHKIWSQQQDNLIKKLMKKVGKNWKVLSQMLGTKTGKQIRERYINKLDPKIKKQDWTEEEDLKLIKLYKIIGSRWSQIAKSLPGRPQNKIKNRFYSYIKKNYEFNERIIEKNQCQNNFNVTTSMQNIIFQKQNIIPDEQLYSDKGINKFFTPLPLNPLESIQLMNLNRQPFATIHQTKDSGLQIKTYNNFSEGDCFIYLSNSIN